MQGLGDTHWVPNIAAVVGTPYDSQSAIPCSTEDKRTWICRQWGLNEEALLLVDGYGISVVSYCHLGASPATRTRTTLLQWPSMMLCCFSVLLKLMGQAVGLCVPLVTGPQKRSMSLSLLWLNPSAQAMAGSVLCAEGPGFKFHINLKGISETVCVGCLPQAMQPFSLWLSAIMVP